MANSWNCQGITSHVSREGIRTRFSFRLGPTWIQQRPKMFEGTKMIPNEKREMTTEVFSIIVKQHIASQKTDIIFMTLFINHDVM